MYSVFINKRPLKVAFLINPSDENWQEQLDAIWKYNLEQWGGRYNPIVPTNGEAIEDDWWLFLQNVDPDYVISTTPLHTQLEEELKVRIRPIDVEIAMHVGDTNIKPNVHTYNDGIPSLPSNTNLRKLSRGFIDEPILALLRSSKYVEDKTIYRFILRSFGLYSDAIPINNVLEKVDRVAFNVNDKSELINALMALSQPRSNYVFPIQFSMLGQTRFSVEFEYKYSYDVCLIIIGDTIEEQIYTWNKVYYARDTQPSRLNHIWIPSALAKDYDVAQALGLWLRRVAQNIHLCSFSLSSDELEQIGNQITETTQFIQPLYKEVTVFNEFPFPKYPQQSSWVYISPPQESDHYRAFNINDGFEIKSPSQTESLSERGYWIAEVYAEADRSHLYNYKLTSESGQFWWQFPRKNYLVRNIFQTNSQIGGKVRVNTHGIPCVQLSAKNPLLKIKLPSELALMRHAVVGDFYSEGRITYETSPSNIGRYLTGFLKVFGSLDSAYQVLSSRYWRRMFDVLSKRDLTKDAFILNEVKNTLTKKINQWGSIYKLKEEIENLTEFVIRLAKKTYFEGSIVDYSRFLDEARKELEDFNTEHKKNWEFEEEALHRDISDMLRLGILLIGLNQPCPRCGSANWYQVNEVNQNLICTGCRFTFSLPAEPKWSYRLSSLVQQGISLHGLVPVVLVLGQILSRSRSSFFFSSPLDFYKVNSFDPPDYDNLGDLDVVCISDGRLIIGEIKQSQGLFDLKQMLKLADVAAIISADELIFSSLDIQPARKTLENLERVKERLRGTKVQVEWYQLENHIFEPEPVR